MSYYMMMTATGLAKQAAANAASTPWEWAEMVFGDGNGVMPVPNGTETELVNEVCSRALNSLTVHPEHANWLIATAHVPGTVGGWTVRELGVRDVDGDLIAYGNRPAIDKPLPGEGSTTEILQRVTVAVVNAANVTITIDPASVLATMEYVDSALAAYVQKAGDIMLGPLILDDDPILPLGAATMQYVDNAIDADVLTHRNDPAPHPNWPRAVGSDLYLYSILGGL